MGGWPRGGWHFRPLLDKDLKGGGDRRTTALACKYT